MKVALVMMPSWGINHPPLGISLVAGALKNSGHDIKVYDLNIKIFNKYKDRHEDLWNQSRGPDWSDDQIYDEKIHPVIMNDLKSELEKIIIDNPSCIGFSTYSSNLKPIIYASSIIRILAPQVKILCGGQIIEKQTIDRLVNNKIIDAFISGESEEAAVNLINSWENNDGSLDIKGVSTFDCQSKNDKIENCRAIQPEKIPKPYFDDYNLTDYLYPNVLPVMMSRGCVAKCNFCWEIEHWEKLRVRPAKNIIEEIEYNCRNNKITSIDFCDSLINGNLNALEEVIEGLIRNKIYVGWGGQLRVDKRLSKKKINRMKDAGCSFFSIGIESGSQRILEKMNKKFKICDAESILRHSYKAGINIYVNIIIGFPGETEDDYLQTLSFLIKNRKFIKFVNLCQFVVFDNTYIARNLDEFDISTQDFHSENWKSKDGTNNIEERLDKLERTRKFLNFIKLSYDHEQWQNEKNIKFKIIYILKNRFFCFLLKIGLSNSILRRYFRKELSKIYT